MSREKSCQSWQTSYRADKLHMISTSHLVQIRARIFEAMPAMVLPQLDQLSVCYEKLFSDEMRGDS